MPSAAITTLEDDRDAQPVVGKSQFEAGYYDAGEEGITETGWYWWRSAPESPVSGPFKTLIAAANDAELRRDFDPLPRAPDRERGQLPALHVCPH